MPRRARQVVPGFVYHITQRGNYQQQVFFDDQDMRRYLCLTDHYSQKYGLNILAYCLMPNHVHYIAIPMAKNSLARTFLVINGFYAAFINKKRRRTGHLWQGRFFSCPMDTPHLRKAVRYVERNPARAGMVTNPWDWPWSSAREHLKQESGVVQLSNIEKYLKIPSWKEYLKETEDEKDLAIIRKYTAKGWMLAEEDVVRALETRYKTKLLPPKMGRPKK